MEIWSLWWNKTENILYSSRVNSIVWLHQLVPYETEKKLDGNFTRMWMDVLNKPRKQHSTKKQLDSHLPPIC